jgi:hypothetical protein
VCQESGFAVAPTLAAIREKGKGITEDALQAILNEVAASAS